MNSTFFNVIIPISQVIRHCSLHREINVGMYVLPCRFLWKKQTVTKHCHYVEFVLIRIIGIWAIVLSSVVSNIMLDLSRYYVVRKDFHNRSLRFIAISAALALGIINSVLYYCCSNTINVIAFVLSALTFLALNRVLLLDIWKMIKTKMLGRKP